MSSPVKETQRNKNEILNDIFDSQSEIVSPNADDDDDFNPRGSVQSKNPTSSEFGDFASAFGDDTTSKTGDGSNDEFADFTSAFDAGVTISNAANNQPQISLLGSTIPNIGNPMSQNFGSSVLQNTGVGNNLFNSLPPQPQNIVNSNNNQGEYPSYFFYDLE